MQHLKKKSPELNKETYSIEGVQPQTKAVAQTSQQSKTVTPVASKKENSTIKTSFKDLLQQQTVQKEQVVADEKSEDTTETTPSSLSENNQNSTIDDVLRVWPICVQSFENEPHLHSILSEIVPTFENDEIGLQLVSPTQATVFANDIETRLYELLWFQLKNKKIKLRTFVPELTEEETKKKPITAEERYAHLLQINQKIQKLRDTFDVEIE
ncbi:MAG: hypothetical protein M0R02_06685 [Bacteroidales bacterium]|nr:hypothetical protein [Bacteroidales bacterium]